jgi:hypothetical protein
VKENSVANNAVCKIGFVLIVPGNLPGAYCRKMLSAKRRSRGSDGILFSLLTVLTDEM